jgi:cytosine/adenosine deaminase-related metal-dependent hydrolase
MLKLFKFGAIALLAIVVSGFVAYRIGLVPPELEVPQRADAIISGVTIINPGIGRAENQTIVVSEGKIVEVRPTVAADPQSICKNCVAIPGLIDAHVHNPPKLAIGNQELFALLYLAHGVTTVRDTGESDDSIASLAQRLNDGGLVGPHMLRCGPVLDGDPPGWGVARKVLTAAQATAAVDDIAASKPDCIKVYNEIDLTSYQAVRVAAARHGLPVIGHIPHKVGIRNVRDFEAQHFTGLPYINGGRPPVGSDIDDAYFLKMTETEIDAALDEVKARHITLLPTLANIRLRLIASDPAHYPKTPASAYLPKLIESSWNSGAVAGHPKGTEIGIAAQYHERALFVAKRAHDKGIDVLAGTDTLMPWVVPGESLLLEIDDLAKAYGDRESALAAATTLNGKHLGSGKIGLIAPGYRADIVLLPGDPTNDLAVLKSWTILLSDGRRYDRKTVDGWLERYRRHFRSGFYDFVMGKAQDFITGDSGHT